MINQIVEQLQAVLAGDPLTAPYPVYREQHPQGIPKSTYVTIMYDGLTPFYLLGRGNTMDHYRFKVTVRGVGDLTFTLACDISNKIRQVLVGSTLTITDGEFIQCYLDTTQSNPEVVSHTFGNNKIIDELKWTYVVEVQMVGSSLEYSSSSETL